MLRLENIHVKFNDLEVLKGLNCQINKGDFISVMGSNGAGKSTLFDIISGKIKPDHGQIFINDQDITNWSEIKRAPLIGRLFQNIHLASVSDLTIKENIALATLKGRFAGLKKGLKNFPEDIVENILKPLNLRFEKLLDTPMSFLSGGQRQIISFIMTTLVPPGILLLDEPTAALDPKSASLLLTFAKQFITKHKIPTIMITHNHEITKNICNKTWILKEGILL